MDTYPRTPQEIFLQPQRLLVPLFQRPYVWSEQYQWEPLWRDLERVADRLLQNPGYEKKHFLGAVVFQQLQNSTGSLQQRTVIDGQQRLTTLQILLDALHGEMVFLGLADCAARLEMLVRNPLPHCKAPEDRFKVWPTNRDRASFNEVMSAESRINYENIQHKGSRLSEAHKFFAEKFNEWINRDGIESVSGRANALESSARELLQVVVIDLTANENAQEIFETLNARGSQLTAADLIKNFVFQRLLEQGADVEASYSNHWKQFETAFWEQEFYVGGAKMPRSSIFLNHWLISRTSEEILSREVFSRFKSFADYDSNLEMPELLEQIHNAGVRYKQLTLAGDVLEGPIDRVGLFVYRAKALDFEVVKPALIALMDDEGPSVDSDDLSKCLETIESWLVRRMLVRATTKAYNKLFADIVKIIRQTKSGKISAEIEKYFAEQTSDSGYWPDDNEVRRELSGMMAYKNLRRSRIRMVLEAIEDFRRGWIGDKTSMSGVRIRRGTYAIEHILPQSWERHWPLGANFNEMQRNERIHKLGNLTLLSKKLNSAVSNGAWSGVGGKAAHLLEKDVLLINKVLIEAAQESWSEEKIDLRTSELIEDILKIWPVPSGHLSNFIAKVPSAKVEVTLSDLMSAGLLDSGQELRSKELKYKDVLGVVLQDGSIGVGSEVFESPSGAGSAVRGGKATNGWTFWYLDVQSKKNLHTLRGQYLDSLTAEEVDIESDDGDDFDDGAD